MAYTPTEWVTGDVITAEKLNKIEGGIESASSGGGGALVVNFAGSSGLTPDKTNAEIAAAASAGQLVVFKWTRDDGIFFGIAYIALQSGTMTYAQASATNNMYDGMLSTMIYDGFWSSTEKYL